MTEKEYNQLSKNKPPNIPMWRWLQIKEQKFMTYATFTTIIIIFLCIMYSVSKPPRDLTPQEEQELQDLKEGTWPPSF